MDQIERDARAREESGERDEPPPVKYFLKVVQDDRPDDDGQWIEVLVDELAPSTFREATVFFGRYIPAGHHLVDTSRLRYTLDAPAPRSGELLPPILPCPFCGSPASVEEFPSGATMKSGAVAFSVGCDSSDEALCPGYQSLTQFARRSDAVAAWNRRAPAVNSTGET